MFSDVRVSSVEVLRVNLNRLAFPCQYSAMMRRFPRPVPQLSMICKKTTHADLNQQRLTPQNFMSFANLIYHFVYLGTLVVRNFNTPVLIQL